MKIELKSIRHNARLSEDSQAFSAVIWVDGRKAGTADNQGMGGPTSIDPPELEQRLDAYAKTLPGIEVGTPEEPRQIGSNAEIVLGDLLNDHLTEQEVKKAIAGRVVYTKVGRPGEIYRTKKLPATQVAQILASTTIKAKWNVDTFLNGLPVAEAVRLYTATPPDATAPGSAP